MGRTLLWKATPPLRGFGRATGAWCLKVGRKKRGEERWPFVGLERTDQEVTSKSRLKVESEERNWPVVGLVWGESTRHGRKFGGESW